ncbi:ricin-type beta-trefoil lectin domain protein, partial [Cellulomonas sp. 179-A 9B4 NHS]|uniref:ricin-type beta-trefoil lectin domain protein n=1 Tax=Cellulomonas sp. 179-A 9B4 NHS TaxID=3142379 RepID=UPI00399FE7EA
GPAAPAAVPAAASASCGQLFDDFAYTSSSDPSLRARGWSVRTGGGGPGVSGNTWSAAQVDFPGTGAARTMRLRASTDGTPAGTVNAEVSQGRRFLEGTYAARVRFTDAPVTGDDGDRVNQTFFTITPLARPNDPDYGEMDFEYLPNGGWGESGPTLFLTTYETYQPDPWVADNLSTPVRGSLAGWRDLVMQVSGGTVRYYVDGRRVAEHGGHVYPETPLLLDFNIWFLDLDAHTGGVSRYEQEVDYVYYTDREVLTPAAVSSRVAAYRSSGVTHRDDVRTGPCTPSPVPGPGTSPTPTPTTPPTAGATGAVRSGIAGKCLDVSGSSSANGTRVQLWDCNGTAAQRWTAWSDGTLRAFGKCLDARDHGTADGTRLHLWDCGPGQANQRFVEHDGGYRNPVSGRCVDDPGASTANGTQLQLWTCNGTPAQKWSRPGAARR